MGSSTFSKKLGEENGVIDAGVVALYLSVGCHGLVGPFWNGSRRVSLASLILAPTGSECRDTLRCKASGVSGLGAFDFSNLSVRVVRGGGGDLSRTSSTLIVVST